MIILEVEGSRLIPAVFDMSEYFASYEHNNSKPLDVYTFGVRKACPSRRCLYLRGKVMQSYVHTKTVGICREFTLRG